MRLLLRQLFAAGALVVVFGALLFGSAGRVDLPAFWGYLAVWGSFPLVAYALAFRRHPDLLEERMRPPAERDHSTQRAAALFTLGHLVVAGFDAGRGLLPGPTVPRWLQLIAFAALAVGLGFVVWTFAVNRFASSAVRVQSDRSQTVIAHGPYALVRHPMYFGTMVAVVVGGVALGSLWSALTLAALIPVFVRRTRLEDRMLHEELDGYSEYASRVRWKVVPGLF